MTPEERANDVGRQCDRLIAIAIREAVAEERVRCAKIADAKVERPFSETAVEAATEIAARIRSGYPS